MRGVLHRSTPLIGTSSRLHYRPDGIHLPCIEAFQHRVPAMGPQRNSQAVFASWIDPHCKILPLINEDLDDTAIDEDTESQPLVTSLHRSFFRRSRPHIGKRARTRSVENDLLV